MADFSSCLRTLSNIHFNKHPDILRIWTVNNADGSAPSALERSNELLYIADENFFDDILVRQESYVAQGETVEHQADLRKALLTNITKMKRRSLLSSLVFSGVWGHLSRLLLDRLGSGFEGRHRSILEC